MRHSVAMIGAALCLLCMAGWVYVILSSLRQAPARHAASMLLIAAFCLSCWGGIIYAVLHW
jgi:drug/metabolite transporter (DMT)-like permease